MKDLSSGQAAFVQPHHHQYNLREWPQKEHPGKTFQEKKLLKVGVCQVTEEAR